MKILEYLLYAFGRPCSHYIPRPSSRKSNWHKKRKKVHELDAAQYQAIGELNKKQIKETGRRNE